MSRLLDYIYTPWQNVKQSPWWKTEENLQDKTIRYPNKIIGLFHIEFLQHFKYLLIKIVKITILKKFSTFYFRYLY